MYLFLVDLRSVTDERYRYWERLIPELHAHHLMGEIREVESNAALVQVVAESLKKARYKTIVAVGDDAFLAALAGATLEAGTALGYVPLGERCAFGWAADLSATPGMVGAKLAGRKLKTFDLFRIGRWYVVDGLHIGYLRQYVENFRPTEGMSLGKSWQRLKASALFWQQTEKFTVELQLGEAELRATVSSLSILNAARLGSRCIPGGQVSPQDGLLSVLLLNPGSAATWQKLLQDPGKLFASPERMSHLRLKECVVRLAQALPVWVDGQEVQMGREFGVRVIASAFRLIV